MLPTVVPGQPAPLPEVEALVGLVGHPTSAIDLYTYFGEEQVGRKFFNVGGRSFGYGNPQFINAGCFAEDSTATCRGNTRELWQVTAGAWWRFLHGEWGTLIGGAQYSYTKRYAFEGVGGAPKADENIVMVSLRYMPFQ